MIRIPSFNISLNWLLIHFFVWVFVLLATITKSIAQYWVPLGPFQVPALNDARDRSLQQAQGIGRVGDLKFVARKNQQQLLLCTPYSSFFISDDTGRVWRSATSLVSFDIGFPATGAADISVHPKRPSELLVATGDADCILDPNGPGMNSESCQSRGLFRSVDNGRTFSGPIGVWYDAHGKVLQDFWKYPSFKISRKLIRHPSRPNQLLVTITTNSFSTKKSDSYIFRSEDNGNTWHEVLFVPDGALKDLILSPACKSTVYAAGRTVFRSCNFGRTWVSLCEKGLPADSLVNRCELAVTPAAKKNLFVLVNLRSGKSNDLYIQRSRKDAFQKVVSGASSPEWRTALAVDAANPGLIYFSAGNKVNRFEQIGASWRTVMSGNGLHDDVHELIPDPAGNGMYVATDGGLSVTRDSGKTWTALNYGLNVAQCWGLAVSSVKDTVRLLAGLQDCGTIQLDFTLKEYSKEWKIVRGGDGMKPGVFSGDSMLLHATDGNNNLNHISVDGGKTWKMLMMPRNQPAEYLRPFALDPFDANKLYSGYGDVYRSQDRGQTWKRLGVPGSGSDKIIAIAVSPSNPKIIYAAYAQPCWKEEVRSKLFRSVDDGLTWTDISKGLRGASWTSISSLAIHPADPDLIIVGFRGGGAVKAMIGKLDSDSTFSWKDFSSGLPLDGDVNALCFDPSRSFVLYAATHHGVWATDNNGKWADFNLDISPPHAIPNLNMHPVFISDIVIDSVNRLLFAGTHGAGIWMYRLR